MKAAPSVAILFRKNILSMIVALLLASACHAQDSSPSQPPSGSQTPNAGAPAADSGTSTDLWIMLGSDFVRPGLDPKANYNIGIGHTFGFLKNDPFGDELTFSYTYEDAGPTFWHSRFGSDTESWGVMKNFGIPKTKMLTAYTWIQLGVTTFTGGPHLQNEFYDGESLGGIVHFTEHHSIWFQETFNKIISVPWYTTFSLGYTRSW